MNIHAQKGAKVRFTHPTAGFPSCQADAKRYLTVGATYTVECVHRSDAGNLVILQETPLPIAFNAVLFDDVTEDARPASTREKRAEMVQDEFHKWAEPVLARAKLANGDGFLLRASEAEKLLQIVCASTLSRDLRNLTS